MKNLIKSSIFGFALMNFSGFIFLMSANELSYFTFFLGFGIIMLGLILNIKEKD